MEHFVAIKSCFQRIFNDVGKYRVLQVLKQNSAEY